MILAALGIYGLVGLMFSLAFVTLGAGQIDDRAREGGWGFRLLLIPGSIALWPYLAQRWWRAAGKATVR